MPFSLARTKQLKLDSNGKGKGSFDHWAARVAVNQVVFEIKGILHDKVIRDALRLAGNKLPGRFMIEKRMTPLNQRYMLTSATLGQYEIIRKGDPAVVGMTKLDGITLADLKRPRKAVASPLLTNTQNATNSSAAKAPGSASP